MIKVMVATPAYNSSVTVQYAASMFNLAKKSTGVEGLEVDLMYGTNEALITYARNICANMFMKSDATHLLFIDSDIQFDPEQVIRMMLTGEDFVCGVYPKKKIDWDAVRIHALRGAPAKDLQSLSNEYLVVQKPDAVGDDRGLLEIERAATGMMMLSRRVFDKLADKVDTFRLVSPVQSNIKFAQDEDYKEYFFTRTDPDTGIFLNEDFSFCRLWRDSGGVILGAPWVKLYHIGNHVYG